MSAGATNLEAGLPWRAIGWGAAGLLLLVPLVARFPWTGFDFAFAAVLLGSVGIGIELAVRKGGAAYRIGAAAALAAGVLILLVTGAVGIVGSERDDANLLFVAVVALAVAGALAARFRAAGMAAVMAVACAAQLLVPVAAYLLFPDSRGALWAPEVPLSTLFLAALWLASSLSFRRAAAGR